MRKFVPDTNILASCENKNAFQYHAYHPLWWLSLLPHRMATLPCTPLTMHAPCHVHPLPCMPPLPCTRAPLPCMPLHHACPLPHACSPFTMHTSLHCTCRHFTMHAQLCHTCLSPVDRQMLVKTLLFRNYCCGW